MSKEETNVNNLFLLRSQIEKMSKMNQVEILRIITNNNTTVNNINENKYGIHINLTELSEDILEQLRIHVDYVNNQDKYLNSDENEKKMYKNTYFVHEDNDIKV